MSSSCTKTDLIDLFNKHVAANREAILFAYQQQMEEKQRLESVPSLGRGQRMRQRSKRIEDHEIKTEPDSDSFSNLQKKSNSQESKKKRGQFNTFPLPMTQQATEMKELTKPDSTDEIDFSSPVIGDSIVSSDEDQQPLTKSHFTDRQPVPKAFTKHRPRSPLIMPKSHKTPTEDTDEHRRNGVHIKEANGVGHYDSDEDDYDYSADSSDFEDTDEEAYDDDLNAEEVTMLLKGTYNSHVFVSALI
ncbi:hypothetical protein EC973_002728 [Apophysomyces ossiformis]|uniref:Uncharacterized protein n=1 Tax=Apophysomyces ossiformis TaxID=679940 RepID=A0A8H7BMH9_9FUNG|nr:hypothetical protein EC973_002728 [Apophysomyces ossiformis]